MLVGVFSFLILFVTLSRAEDELIAVSLMYRHGDRTPLVFYHNDPYKDRSYWPEPPGELTNVGKLQHYELGKWLRNRYGNFLSEIYDKNEIYIRSSDNDRCLMSAAANLAGLYPPKANDVWNSNLLWQPIPIHTMPTSQDDIAEVYNSCPIYNNLKNQAEQLPYFKHINDNNKELYEYLTEKSGSNMTELVKVSDLYDILLIEEIHNLTSPNWTIPVYSQLQEIGDISPQLFTYTKQLARLFVGRFFDSVLNQFQSFQIKCLNYSDNTEYKFKVFSAHDDQVFSILNVLKVPNLKKIPFAAMVVLELRAPQNGEQYVQVLYKTKPDVADIVQIEGCGTKCNISSFAKILQPYRLTEEEYENECD